MADTDALPALLASSDWGSAERLLRRAAQRAGAGADVFYNLALVLDRAGKGAQSGAWLLRAVARRPDYAAAWFELGRWRLDARDLWGARHAFACAGTLDPADADARRNLGRVALRLGRWDEAARTFAGADDAEARIARYRIAAETGEDARPLLDRLLAGGAPRQAVLTAMTRTARGRIPLHLRHVVR